MGSSTPTPDASAVRARDARAEAQRVVGPALAARVLEPSPPAVEDEWFADDPILDNGGRGDEQNPGVTSGAVVAPVPGPWTTWSEWLSAHPEHAGWAGSRWLGAFRRLPRPPSTLTATREALHRIAVAVLAPARRRVNGKIGLRYTYGGFGTPFFGDDEQVRVAGATLVRQRGDRVVAAPIVTLAGAAELALDGPPDVAWSAGLDVPDPGDPNRALPIDPAASTFLGDWFGFAFSVLEELRVEAESVDPSRVQLWPEHFDAAFDCLSEADGRRATFGASPGDAAVDEPYLYVTPWRAESITPGGLWNATSFPGAVFPLRSLVDRVDQRAAALDFFRERRRALTE